MHMSRQMRLQSEKRTRGGMRVPSSSRPTTGVVGLRDGDSGPNATHSKGNNRNRTPSCVKGFALCCLCVLGGRNSALVWLVGAMVTYIADLCGLQTTTLLSALGTISLGGVMGIFFITINDLSSWLIVIIPILIVYIVLLASSAILQFQFMWDHEVELLEVLNGLVNHGMPFLESAVISWGVGCMLREEWMSWALMLSLGISWLSRSRHTTEEHKVSQENIMSDGIFKWSFAFAPALLAIYVSLAYIGDGFDLSSVLLHLSVPWLVLAPSLAWLGVSFVICFESAKLNKALWSLLVSFSREDHGKWLLSIPSLTLSLAVYLAAIISVLPYLGMSKGRTNIIQKCLMVIASRCLGQACGGFLWHEQLCLDVTVYCSMTFLLLGGNFLYWGGAVLSSSLGLMLYFGSTDLVFGSDGGLHSSLNHFTTKSFGVTRNIHRSYDDGNTHETLDFGCPVFVMSAVLLLGLGMLLPIAVTSHRRNAPPHILSMALVLTWASLISAMELFLLKSEVEYNRQTRRSNGYVVFYPLWCSLLTTVIGLLCLWRVANLMKVEFRIVVGHMDLKVVFAWVVVCILFAKTIVATPHHFTGRKLKCSIWMNLLLLLCLSGPFVVRARGSMNGLEGTLWVVFTAFFTYLSVVEGSLFLDSMCWKALRIQAHDDDNPVGCKMGVAQLLLGLYGAFLANYHFPENMRARSLAGTILISACLWILFGPRRAPSAADVFLQVFVVLGPLVMAMVGQKKLKQWRSLIRAGAASSGFVLGLLISSHVLDSSSKSHMTRIDGWLSLVHANGLAAAAVLVIEATPQISTRNSKIILILCWTVLALLLGPPATLALLLKRITWEAWQACTLLTLQTHVVVALVIQYNTGYLFRGRHQKRAPTQRLSGEQQPFSPKSSTMLLWKTKLANGSIVLTWALGTCLAFGRGSDSFLGAIGMGFTACVLFLLQGYSGIKKWAPPFVGVWVSWFVAILHHWFELNMFHVQDEYYHATMSHDDVSTFDLVVQVALLVILAPVLWFFIPFLWTGGLSGFSGWGSLMLSCVACLPALIGADSPSLHLMALTGLGGSIFQMKFRKDQSEKHLKII